MRMTATGVVRTLSECNVELLTGETRRSWLSLECMFLRKVQSKISKYGL